MIKISIPELNLGFPYLVAKKEDIQEEPQSQNIITKTCLFKCSENFTTTIKKKKEENFQKKKF